MAANLTNYGAQQHLASRLSYYLGLNTGDPGQSGSANEVGAGVGYTRQACTLTAGTLAQRNATNGSIITFGPASGAGFGTVAYCTLWDASSGGNAWWYGPITNKAIVAGDSYTVPVGYITVTLPASINP